ncbi:NIC-domain-containing protein [Lindgomyces ingoldianus]|uniref:NIC-domain-containing protein n=1 Tax=Lindgomyces ingoldianus TaxID=673940 RepID=A0ACB6R1Y9_9PLEO|nr:NIC-domain-containing protein [Lindgomyces ingoldianus]KAF2473206.1 NIC-domain-containing protein [Lindgomyces ingoldianus]
MSSLFGNLGGGGQPSSGASSTPKPLFGTAATSTNPFPSLSASTSGPSGTSQPASSSGLGGSLFGASTAKTTAPGTASTTSSLFPAASSQAQTGGLFSTPASKPAQQSTTANLLSNLGQTAAPGQSSFFSTPATQPPQQPQPGGPLSQTSNVAGRSAHFDHLLERGRKRNAGENGLSSFDELPSLQLGLGDIARKVRNLGAGGPSADLVQDRAAHYLLSASGVKMGSTLRDLNQFTTQAGLSTAGPATNILDTDVDGYISNLHSQSTLAMIQEGLEQSKRDFDTFLEENVQIEWDAQRKRIYEHFGLGKQSEDMAASQATFGSSAVRGAFGRPTRKGRSMGAKGASTNGATFGASGAQPVIGSVFSPYQKKELAGQEFLDKSAAGQVGPTDRFMRDKQEKFMEKVKELNVARLEDNPFPVLHAFSEVEAQSGAENTDHFINAYAALISITGENRDPKGANVASNPRERGFAQEYLDDQPNSASSVRTRKRILDGSRKFLEKKFLDEVDVAVRKHAREAQIGGIPSLLSRIRGYIRVKMAFKELGTDTEQLQRIGGEGEEFPWVIVFYLLRAGLTADAAQYVRDKKNFFQNNDRNFQAAISFYASDPDRRLSPELQQKINHVYAQRARIAPTNDPYRMACYKIIGRCEMSRRNLEPLKESMDDWVWLQFNLAREGNRAEENAGEAFGLEELRATISDIGQRHFMSGPSEAAGGFGVYFYLATLAGMFEQAVNFLYQHAYVSAVHFAIALDYYGLLRVSDWSSAGLEILTHTTRQLPQLNFGRVVGFYTRDFRAARADAAAEYLILICLNADLAGEAGKQQASLCHEALRELVLETREFTTLLGDVKANGQSTQGLIQERVPLIKLSDDAALLNVIISEAAKMADDNGRTNDAVLLRHLAGEYDGVVVILNRALSEALSVDLGQEPLRLEPLKPRIAGANPEPQPDLTNSSLSLLGTDDPVTLARMVMGLYDNNALWWSEVAKENRDALRILYLLNDAKKVIEQRRFMEALDIIQSLDVLPLNAEGSLPLIRTSANNFSQYPPEIARNIGNVLLWCIGCCSRHREILLSGQWEDPTRKALADMLLQKAKDLMVFAGLIRYKLPPRVFETLAKEGQDAGVY